jgi:hypothetical protein
MRRRIPWWSESGHEVTRLVIDCEICGKEVFCVGFTNTCECGADYNMSGNLLTSREQWGEETGESLADIMRIP